VGARDVKELVCYQLAVNLRDRIDAVCQRPAIVRDRKFCDQLRNAAASVPRNIAEGFFRYVPGEFRRYLSIALGSLGEVENHLRHALTLRYIEPSELFDPDGFLRLIIRVRTAILGLLKYLNTLRRERGKPRTRRTPRT
jgi:four helix bundle protein